MRFEELKRGKVTLTNFTKLGKSRLMEILEWRNHDDIRKWMNNSTIIGVESHLAFVEKLRNNQKSFYWLAERKGRNCGVVYLHVLPKNSTGAEWGLYVAPQFLGTGIGLELSFESTHLFFEQIGLKVLYGNVKSDNYESLRLHKAFHYSVISTNTSSEFVHLMLEKQYYMELPKDFLDFQKMLVKGRFL